MSRSAPGFADSPGKAILGQEPGPAQSDLRYASHASRTQIPCHTPDRRHKARGDFRLMRQTGSHRYEWASAEKWLFGENNQISFPKVSSTCWSLFLASGGIG